MIKYCGIGKIKEGNEFAIALFLNEIHFLKNILDILLRGNVWLIYPLSNI